MLCEAFRWSKASTSSGLFGMCFVAEYCRIRFSISSVYSLFRSKLSLHKGQISILWAGFVHGESTENISYRLIKPHNVVMVFSNARGFPYAFSNSRASISKVILIIACAAKIYHSCQADVFYRIE